VHGEFAFGAFAVEITSELLPSEFSPSVRAKSFDFCVKLRVCPGLEELIRAEGFVLRAQQVQVSESREVICE
jgi:hypothetical protein